MLEHLILERSVAFNFFLKVHPDEKKVKSEDVSNILEDVKTLRVKHGAVQTQLESLKMYLPLYFVSLCILKCMHSKMIERLSSEKECALFTC